MSEGGRKTGRKRFFGVDEFCALVGRRRNRLDAKRKRRD